MDLRRSILNPHLRRTDHRGSRISNWKSKSKVFEPVLIWKFRSKAEMKKSHKFAGYFIIIMIVFMAIITFVSVL